MTIYTKVCSKCKINKPLVEFGKDKYTKDGIDRRCKSCHKEHKDQHSEQIRQRSKERYEANKEQIKERAREYRRVNKTLITEREKNYRKEYNREYLRVKRLTDPLFCLTARLRSLVGISFRRKGYSKKSRTHEILGCSYEEFKAHIESQFTEGMSWDNRDKWHLDHIKPVSLGSTEEEILELNHYKNFQPLWAMDNILKSNKYDEQKGQQKSLTFEQTVRGRAQRNDSEQPSVLQSG